MNVEVLESIARVPEAEWDALDRGSFPFSRREYLLILEQTGCVGSDTGWTPMYACARDERGKLVGASALYFKSHSYGEYVFDFAWAEAYAQRGREYYPKLVAAIPFAPATGAKFLIAPGADRQRVSRALASAWRELARAARASSAHALFATEDDARVLEELGYARRSGFQFHWANEGYATFDDFASSLRSKRRREMRREREQAKSDLTIERLTGSDLAPEHARAMRAFYRATVDSRMGFPYLTDAFFDAIFERFANQTLFIYARAGSRPVAGALAFFEGDALFGRWWGALEERRALHFELSYYQGIEWAIERGIKRFEAGAQGEHKLARGFLPRETTSMHLMFDGAFQSAIARFCEGERAHVREAIRAYQEQSPFSREGEPTIVG